MEKTDRQFTGKVVLITGAGGGLGSTQAKTFAREGATVAVADINQVRGREIAQSIRKDGGKAQFVELDVVSLESWTKALQWIRNEMGALHVLVNNAGVISRTGVATISLQEWQSVIGINMTGTMLGIQSVAPLIRDSGGGAIVNISSTAGLIAHPGIAYAASKWGLRGITKSAALSLLEWGIRVNSVHPAQVSDTMMTSASSPGWRRANERIIPAGRLASMEEVTRAVLFLASEESSYTNASEIIVDGGAVNLGLPRMCSALAQEFNRSLDME